MNSVQKEYAIGLGFILIGLLMIFVVTPMAVPLPAAATLDTDSVSPRCFPLICLWGIVLFGVLQIVETFLDVKYGYTQPKPAPAFDSQAFVVRVLAILTLVAFYYVAEPLGIILTGLLFYVLYAFYCGERKIVRALIGGTICTLILYYFFVYIAQVPMPAGLLDGVL